MTGEDFFFFLKALLVGLLLWKKKTLFMRKINDMESNLRRPRSLGISLRLHPQRGRNIPRVAHRSDMCFWGWGGDASPASRGLAAPGFRALPGRAHFLLDGTKGSVRWRLPRTPAPFCGLYSAVCSHSCPLLREASATMTSMATTKAAHAAVPSLGFTGRDQLLTHWPTGRAGRAGSAQRARVCACALVTVFSSGRAFARANTEP